MKLTRLLQKAKRELRFVSHQAYQESLWILERSLNAPANQIYLENITITSKQEENFWRKIKQRKKRVPLEYILKEKFFFDHKFYLENSVFIPRPETETLVKWVCKNIPKNQFLNFIDFGAGAGAISASISYHFLNSVGTAIELYPKAITCLEKNILNLKLKDRLYLLKKDVSNIQLEDLYQLYLKTQKYSHFSNQNSNPFIALPDLITANPPYIDPKDKNIQQDIYLYESPLALFSDKKGLGHIISWFKKAIQLLKPKGLYIFEFAWNQKEQITEFLNSQTTIDSYNILKDQLGHPRIAVCYKKNL